MIINRKSWHSRFYRWSWGNEKSESLCTYFWKIVFGVILTPIGVSMMILIWISGWFIGFWPNFRWDEKRMFQSRYKFDGRRQHRFAPWEIALPLVAVGGVVNWAITDWTGFSSAAIWVGITLAVIAFLAGLIFLICRGWRTEAFKLFRAYIAAKKRKVCPLITFEG